MVGSDTDAPAVDVANAQVYSSMMLDGTDGLCLSSVFSRWALFTPRVEFSAAV